MADWRELYKATVLETNPTQLEQLTKETEDAIFLRVRQLARTSDRRTPQDGRSVGGTVDFEDPQKKTALSRNS